MTKKILILIACVFFVSAYAEMDLPIGYPPKPEPGPNGPLEPKIEIQKGY